MTAQLRQDRLDELFNFSEPAGSELRLRAEANAEPDPSVAAELLTQVARALGLQEKYADADELLDSIDDPDGAVAVRVLLERGRLRTSADHLDQAVPLFEAALLIAAAEDLDYLEIDSAHMLAIADPARAAHWTARALETVDESTDPRIKRWAVSLHNNLGWKLFDDGKSTEALAEFELAADAAREFGSKRQQELAQHAIDEVIADINDADHSADSGGLVPAEEI